VGQAVRYAPSEKEKGLHTKHFTAIKGLKLLISSIPTSIAKAGWVQFSIKYFKALSEPPMPMGPETNTWY
jgi:hypothetical protein